MENENMYYFGGNIFTKGQMVGWDPDAKDMPNGHLIVCGKTGSGKTATTLNIIKWLALPTEFRGGKNIYLLDLHGDMKVHGVEENHLIFKGRNSEHGINPFDFDKDPENGGVEVQVTSIVTTIKKAFMPNMGVRQESVLRQLILDSYKLMGISDHDTSTWDMKLPSMETMLGLIDDLLTYHKQRTFSVASKLQIMDERRRKLKEYDSAGYFMEGMRLAREKFAALETLRKEEAEDVDKEADKADKKAGIEFVEEQTLDEIEDAEYERAKQASNKWSIESDMIEFALAYIASRYPPSDCSKIASAVKGIYKQETDALFLMEKYREYCLYEKHADLFGAELPEAINPYDYESKDVIRALEGLRLYIGMITTSGIFCDKRPPIKSGLNRLDISGLEPELQSFFVDSFVNKQFMALKRRGLYANRVEKKKGAKYDTVICIDEGASILPNGSAKEDTKQIINKTIAEMRKYGLMIIFVSQSPTDFSNTMLSAHTKVVLQLQANVQGKAMTQLGIKDKSLFNILERPRTGLVGLGTDFKAVNMVDLSAAPAIEAYEHTPKPILPLNNTGEGEGESEAEVNWAEKFN